jgi:hypothetical protein
MKTLLTLIDIEYILRKVSATNVDLLNARNHRAGCESVAYQIVSQLGDVKDQQ